MTIPYVKRFILPFPVRYLHFFSGIVRRGVAFDVAFRQIPEDRARTVPDIGPYFLCGSASVEVPGYRQGVYRPSQTVRYRGQSPGRFGYSDPLFRAAQFSVGFQAGSFQGAVFRSVPFAARGYLHQPEPCHGRDGEGDPRRKAVAFARRFGGDLSGGHAFARRRNPSFQGGGFHAGPRGRRRDPAGGVVRYDHNDRPQRDVQLAQ